MAKIRVWKLGSLNHNVTVTDEAMKKFRDLLDGIKSGESGDIIWNDAISVIEIDNSKDVDNELCRNGD